MSEENKNDIEEEKKISKVTEEEPKTGIFDRTLGKLWIRIIGFISVFITFLLLAH